MLYDDAFERENKNLGLLYGLSKTKELLEKQQLNYELKSSSKIEKCEATGEKKKRTYWEVIKCDRKLD